MRLGVLSDQYGFDRQYVSPGRYEVPVSKGAPVHYSSAVVYPNWSMHVRTNKGDIELLSIAGKARVVRQSPKGADTREDAICLPCLTQACSMGNALLNLLVSPHHQELFSSPCPIDSDEALQ